MKKIPIKIALNLAWVLRGKLLAEGTKLWAEGAKLRAEGDKLWAEGNKLWAESIIEFCGNVKMEWKSDGSCAVEGVGLFEKTN
jgi:hypothetical protein